MYNDSSTYKITEYSLINGRGMLFYGRRVFVVCVCSMGLTENIIAKDDKTGDISLK